MAIASHPFTDTGDTTNPRAIEAAATADLDGPSHISELLGDVLIDAELIEIYARDYLDIRFGDACDV